MVTAETSAFYTRLVEANHGPDVINETGSRPRGSYTRAMPGDVKIMVILQNPGKPEPIEEVKQRGKSGAQLAKTIWDMTGDVLDGLYYSKTFSKMREELALLLTIKEEGVYDNVLVCNLIRCSTKNNAQPTPRSVSIAIPWLKEKIALWKPHKIITYSNWVKKNLEIHSVTYDSWLPHPAARGNWMKQNVRKARVQAAQEELERVPIRSYP